MLTTIEQLREWITDNGLKRWVLYRDYGRTEKIIDSGAFPVSDMEDKLAMTEKYLRLAGGHAYAAGGTSGSKADLDTTTEIRLADTQTQPTQGVGVLSPDAVGELRKSLSNEIRAQIKAEQYEKEKADFEKAKKEFEAEKQSAMGTLVHYLAPIGQMLLEKKMMPRVAGVDTDEPLPPVDTPQDGSNADAEQSEQSPFTDEEADRLFELMARFKKVEPDYLRLIESVVVMAENGDATYNMAKGFLVK